MKRMVLAVLMALAFVGCGGGGSGSSIDEPKQDSSGEGMWKGLTNTGSSIIGFVLDDGTFYAVYTDPYESHISGIVHGNGRSSNGVFTASNAKDYYFGENPYISNATVSANYSPKQSFSGSLTYPSRSTIAFSTTYITKYDLTANLASLAGMYSVTIMTGDGSDSSTVTVSASGEISGSTTLGCSFNGTAEPHPHGNVYNVSIKMGNGSCVYPGQTLKGMAYYDSTTGEIFAAAPTADRSGGFLLTGNRILY